MANRDRGSRRHPAQLLVAGTEPAVDFPHVAYEDRPLQPETSYNMFFAEVHDRVVAGGQLDAATLEAASALLDDPDYWTQCWMMTGYGDRGQ